MSSNVAAEAPPTTVEEATASSLALAERIEACLLRQLGASSYSGEGADAASADCDRELHQLIFGQQRAEDAPAANSATGLASSLLSSLAHAQMLVASLPPSVVAHDGSGCSASHTVETSAAEPSGKTVLELLKPAPQPLIQQPYSAQAIRYFQGNPPRLS